MTLSDFGQKENAANANPITISVVIPAYNAGRFIVASIESVLQQTVPPLEIIVVDDGSTDDTRERLRVYEGRIRYSFQTNQGTSTARNTGISQAYGEWVAFLDADDVWFPHFLECLSAVIARNPNVALVGTDYLRIDQDGVILGSERPATPTGLEAEPIFLRQLLEAAVFGANAVVIRKKCLEAVGGFTTALKASEDMLMWWSLAVAFPVMKLPAPLAGYRVNPSSVSHNYYKMIVSKKQVLAIAFATLPPLQKHAWLRCVARARVFRESSWELHCDGKHRMAIGDLLISIVNYPFALRSSQGIKLRWDRLNRLCRYILSAFCALVN